MMGIIVIERNAGGFAFLFPAAVNAGKLLDDFEILFPQLHQRGHIDLGAKIEVGNRREALGHLRGDRPPH